MGPGMKGRKRETEGEEKKQRRRGKETGGEFLFAHMFVRIYDPPRL